MKNHTREIRRAQAASSDVKISVILVCVLAAVSAIALTVFNKLCIGDNGLYRNGVPKFIPAILGIIALAVSFFGTMHITKATDLDGIPKMKSPALSILSFTICAEFYAIFIVYFLLGPLDIQYFPGGTAAHSFELAEKMKTAMLCYNILVPLSLVAPVYFVIASIKKRINALFGSVTLIWILLYILRLYFDVTDWVMSPRKLTMICAMCAAALFVLYEVRFAFGRGSSRAYFFLASVAAIFCIACGAAGTACIVMHVYPLNYEMPYFGACLLIGAYALVRVISFIPVPDPASYEGDEDDDPDEEKKTLSETQHV